MLFFFFFLPRLPLISSLLTNPSYPLLWFACVGDPVFGEMFGIWRCLVFVPLFFFLSFSVSLYLSRVL